MTQDEIIRMAREAFGEQNTDYVHPRALERFAAIVAAHERKRFYGQDKPAECANGCPKNQVCDYCQFVDPVLLAVLAEREACAKVCDERAEEMNRRADGEMLTNLGKTVALEKAKTLDMCAAAIRERSANARARGEK